VGKELQGILPADLTERKLQTPEELYDDEDWVDLPQDIKDAYSTLGYNETIWNNELDSKIGSLDWTELTIEPRLAALFLGYTDDSWDKSLRSV